MVSASDGSGRGSSGFTGSSRRTSSNGAKVGRARTGGTRGSGSGDDAAARVTRRSERAAASSGLAEIVVARLRHLSDEIEPDPALVGDRALHPVAELGGLFEHLPLDPAQFAGELPAELFHPGLGLLGRTAVFVHLLDLEPGVPDQGDHPVGHHLEAAVELFEVAADALLDLRDRALARLELGLDLGEARDRTAVLGPQVRGAFRDTLVDCLRIRKVQPLDRAERPGLDGAVELRGIDSVRQALVDLGLQAREQFHVLFALAFLVLSHPLVEVRLEADLDARQRLGLSLGEDVDARLVRELEAALRLSDLLLGALQEGVPLLLEPEPDPARRRSRDRRRAGRDAARAPGPPSRGAGRGRRAAPSGSR